MRFIWMPPVDAPNLGKALPSHTFSKPVPNIMVYLGIYLNLGWVGLILLATVFVTGYHKVIVQFRRIRRWAESGLRVSWLG